MNMNRRQFLKYSAYAGAAAALPGCATTLQNAGNDLGTYRGHAQAQGSRDSKESLEVALNEAGLAGEGILNIFTLSGYSKEAEPFRQNDGQKLSVHTDKILENAWKACTNLFGGIYSLSDWILFNNLPDLTEDFYKTVDPVPRTLVYFNRGFGRVVGALNETGNALSGGYFDNVSGPVAQTYGHVVEGLKHTVESITNLARGPVYLVSRKSECTDRTLDWLLLVPAEFISNVAGAGGVDNAFHPEKALEDKGVIGATLEMGTTTYIAYRATDKLIDEIRGKDKKKTPVQPEPEEEPPDPAFPKPEPIPDPAFPKP